MRFQLTVELVLAYEELDPAVSVGISMALLGIPRSGIIWLEPRRVVGDSQLAAAALLAAAILAQQSFVGKPP